MPPSQIMSRATNANESHDQTASTIVSVVSLVLVLASALLLLVCARQRHCEAKVFDLQRRDWCESRLNHLGTVKSLERQLSCCTCQPALPWNADGSTRQKRSSGQVAMASQSETTAPAPTGDFFSSVLERWLPEKQGDIEMTFWEDAQSGNPPVRLPVSPCPAPFNKNPFVVEDEHSEDEPEQKGGSKEEGAYAHASAA